MPVANVTMGTLYSADGSIADITDHEVDRFGKRIAYIDGRDLNVYAVSIDAAIGSPTTGDFVAGSHVRVTTWLSATPGLATTGTRITLQDFPNGVEWSHASGGSPRLYFSADSGNGIADIVRAEDRGSWTNIGRLNLPQDGRHRWLINATSSNLLEDRVLTYVRSDTTSWRSGAGYWCVDDNTTPPIAIRENVILQVPPGVAVASAPLRPVPDVYALVYAFKNQSNEIELSWLDLGDRGASLSTSLHLYEAWQVNDYSMDVLSVGANRAPNHDQPGRRAFVVYVILEANVPPILGQYTPGSRYTRVDSYLVYYTGNLGGTIAAKGVNLIRPTVAHGRSLHWDALVAPPAPQAQLCTPPAGTARRYILDDENAVGLSNDPYLSLLLCDKPYSCGARNPRTEIWIVPAIPAPPSAGWPPPRFGGLLQNVLEPQEVTGVQATSGSDVLSDAEPLLVNPTDGMFVYHLQLEDRPVRYDYHFMKRLSF